MNYGRKYLFMEEYLKCRSNSDFKCKGGYIMLEVIVYLMIASILLMSLALIFRSSISLKSEIVNKVEMREMASVVEDRIRYELENSIGISNIWSRASNINYDNKNKYTDVRKVEYRAYDKLQKEVLEKKYISLESDRLYIENEGKYQIGRHIWKIDLVDSDNYLDFSIIFKINNSIFLKRFTIKN